MMGLLAANKCTGGHYSGNRDQDIYAQQLSEPRPSVLGKGDIDEVAKKNAANFMDDSNTSNIGKIDCRTPLGMNSFDQNQRKQFGQKVRLAMSCIDGTSELVQRKAPQLNWAPIRKR